MPLQSFSGLQAPLQGGSDSETYTTSDSRNKEDAKKKKSLGCVEGGLA